MKKKPEGLTRPTDPKCLHYKHGHCMMTVKASGCSMVQPCSVGADFCKQEAR